MFKPVYSWLREVSGSHHSWLYRCIERGYKTQHTAFNSDIRYLLLDALPVRLVVQSHTAIKFYENWCLLWCQGNYAVAHDWTPKNWWSHSTAGAETNKHLASANISHVYSGMLTFEFARKLKWFKSPCNNRLLLIMGMVWYRTGDKPSTETMMTQFIDVCARQIIGWRPANERRRYKITLSLIGWTLT